MCWYILDQRKRILWPRLLVAFARKALVWCMHLMTKSSKVAFITSRMGSIGDNLSGSSYGYRMSKVALSMAAKSLSIDLIKENIYVAILHPGLVSTRMTGFTPRGITTEESVKGILKRIDCLNKNNSGTFWHSNGEILPW